jgi:NAD(P)-dependent dehydrogenase (short-subunit alcohol dehydrogenase family)
MALGLSVVCGASGGLGPAVLDAMAALGDPVVGIASPRSEPAKLAALRPDVQWLRADLSDPDSVEALWRIIDGLGEVRRLVNVTGGFAGGTVIETSPRVVRDMFEVNLATAWWSSREAARRMTALGGGMIVNVGSASGVELHGGAAAYAVSKAALHALTRVLSDELRSAGVAVNAVAPVTIDTPANRAWMSAGDLARAVPQEKVAEAIASFCDPSHFVTGQVVQVA